MKQADRKQAGDPGLPAGVRRLVYGYPPGALLDQPDFLIGRLLEEGDREDLAWLAEHYGEERLREWLAARGGRQLSRRSRAFWRRVLAAEPAPAPPVAEELWPL